MRLPIVVEARYVREGDLIQTGPTLVERVTAAQYDRARNRYDIYIDGRRVSLVSSVLLVVLRRDLS